MRKLNEIQANSCITSVKRMESRHVPEVYKCYHGKIRIGNLFGTVVFGYNEGGLMEHVSISSRSQNQLPTWEQMTKLKDIFFYPEEMAVQIHPAENRYVYGVGNLKNVLHLWRPMDGNWEILNHPERWD